MGACECFETVMGANHFLVLGGAKSGKSSYALRLAEEMFLQGGKTGARGLFVATAQASDGEMEERINLHKRQRGAGWQTLEEPLLLPKAVREAGTGFQVILIDCLTMWLSNLLFRKDADTAIEIDALTKALRQCSTTVIMVSNEVGMGLIPDNPLGRRFRDLQGILNQEIAAVSSHVIFMAAGLPLILKDALPGSVNT